GLGRKQGQGALPPGPPQGATGPLDPITLGLLQEGADSMVATTELAPSCNKPKTEGFQGPCGPRRGPGAEPLAFLAIPEPSQYRRVHEVAHEVEALAVPGVGDAAVGEVGERDAGVG